MGSKFGCLTKRKNKKICPLSKSQGRARGTSPTRLGLDAHAVQNRCQAPRSSKNFLVFQNLLAIDNNGVLSLYADVHFVTFFRMAFCHLNNTHKAYGKCDYLYEKRLLAMGDQ